MTQSLGAEDEAQMMIGSAFVRGSVSISFRRHRRAYPVRWMTKRIPRFAVALHRLRCSKHSRHQEWFALEERAIMNCELLCAKASTRQHACEV
jgi:hypothetical protein